MCMAIPQAHPERDATIMAHPETQEHLLAIRVPLFIGPVGGTGGYRARGLWRPLCPWVCFRVCPTFYTWCFSLGCAAHDANHDARTPCCNAHPRLLRELPTARGLEGQGILAGM